VQHWIRGVTRFLSFTGCALAVLMCAGCAGAALKVDRYAQARDFEKTMVEGKGFRHVVYKNPRAATSGTALNVYIEGDGYPWVLGRYIAKNPTSADTLMLHLMAQDPGPALYLGRPCYLGLHEETGCDPKYWSSERYGAAVADSMAAALTRLAPDRRLRLLGHSGGGALAVLLAARVPRVDAVLTLAGNLDTDAWTEIHGYEPLAGSLNPRLQPPLPPAIKQFHIAGGRDKNVYPEFVDNFARVQGWAIFHLEPRQKHDCCWGSVWPEILAILSQM
jgi:pimeloyl-ACP methyl ester carboxylesterase